MNRNANLRRLTLGVALALAVAAPAFAVPFVSDGSDGEFNPQSSIHIDLDNPGDLVSDLATYVPGFFNFSTINIPTGVNVTFSRDATNSAVHFGATGSVVIDGRINASATARSGGPGGGDGGLRGNPTTIDGTSGTGSALVTPPGSVASGGTGGTGSRAFSAYGQGGGGGGMAEPGLAATKLVSGAPGGAATTFPEPISGGFGGGGGGRGTFFDVHLDAGDGGGGGGALQISTPFDITIGGDLLANGATGGVAFANVFSRGGPGGGGSGGNFELNAGSILIDDSALIQATGGFGGGISTQPVGFDPDFYSSEADGGAGYVFFDTDDLSIADGASIAAVMLIPGGEPAGSSPDNPLLPTDGGSGSPWRFDVPGDVVLQFFPGTIWFDPEVAVGFEYEVLAGPNFASVTAPTGFGDDLYELLLIDPGTSQFVPVATLPGGVLLDLRSLSPFGSALVDGIDLFRIAGIEPAAAVNPGDPLGFPTGLGFMSADDVSFTMKPLLEQIASVSEPTTTALLALGMLGVGFARKRRTH